MHSLDPTVLPIKRFFKSIIFFHVWQDTKKIPNFDRNTYYSHNFDVRFLPIHPIFPIYLYLPPPRVKIQRKVKLEYTEYISTHAQFHRPIFDPLSKLLHGRAREKSRALVFALFSWRSRFKVCAFALFGFGARQCRQAAGGNRFWSGAGEGGRVASRTGFKREQSSVALRGAAWRMVGGDPLCSRGGGRLAATSDGLQL